MSRCFNLRELTIRCNALRRTENLPASLKVLNLSFNRLQRVAGLPAGLEVLILNSNQLREVPALPPGLRVLNVASNPLECLCELPATLEELCISNCNIVPLLPPGLRKLAAGRCEIVSLPCTTGCSKPCDGCLPPALEHLDLNGNKLAALPELPATLRTLNLSNNKFVTLPKLPAGLQELHICGNRNLSPGPLPILLNKFYLPDSTFKYCDEWKQYLPPYLMFIAVHASVHLIADEVNSGRWALVRRQQDRIMAMLVLKRRLRFAVPDIGSIVLQFL